MQATKLTCPDCNATLQTAKPIPPGAKIKCPKCGSSFAVPAAANGNGSGVKPINRIAASSPTKSAVRKSRPMPKADVDDDDDDIDDRPRKKKKKFKSRKESGSGAMLWVVLGIVFVLLAGGGVLAFILLNNDNKPEIAKNNNDPSANAANLRPGENGRSNRPPFDPNNPPNRPPFGQGNQPGRPPMRPPNMPGQDFNPLASIDFASLDFGDLAAKQASQVDAIKYLPANCTSIGAFDFANLYDAQPFKPFQNPQGAEAAMQTFGVSPEEIECIAMGTKEFIFDSFQRSGKDNGVMVVKTKKPYDQAKVRENLKAGDAEQIEGKNVYKLPGKFPSLFMPSDRILILAHLPQEDLAGLVTAKGDQSALAPELSAMINKVGQSHLWVVIAGEQFQHILNGVSGEIKIGGSAPGGESAKPLTDALGKAKAGALSLRLQGKQVKLAASALCEDANSSKQLSGALQLMWGLLGNTVLEKVKTQIPNLAPLVTDVQKTQFKSQGELAQVALDINFASFAPLAKMGPSDWMDLQSSLASMAGDGAGSGGGGGVASKPPGGGGSRRKLGGGDDQPPAGDTTGDNAIEGFEIGNRAPDISGKDTTGKTFKLSDYRGKVVVLDFWGFWWGPCVAMFPHERSLVKKMQGKPFALLGVNTDDNLNKIKPQLQKEITWRSWYDGQGGPICKQYQVRSFPTIYVLDAKGVIRYKNVRNEAMDNAVETLIKELEKSGGGTASADDKPPEKGSDEKPAAGGGSNASAPIGFEIGNRAPEITGKDTTGKTFKLSEYKGKVVVLDFWGFWWPPCVAMIPHERSLVEKLQGQPFALLGINTDANVNDVKQKSMSEQVTWRSWYDGQQGPIVKQYKVRSFPTIYVLDHKGVIRYKNVRADDLDKAVETLLKEAEKETKAGG